MSMRRAQRGQTGGGGSPYWVSTRGSVMRSRLRQGERRADRRPPRARPPGGPECRATGLGGSAAEDSARHNAPGTASLGSSPPSVVAGVCKPSVTNAGAACARTPRPDHYGQASRSPNRCLEVVMSVRRSVLAFLAAAILAVAACSSTGSSAAPSVAIPSLTVPNLSSLTPASVTAGLQGFCADFASKVTAKWPNIDASTAASLGPVMQEWANKPELGTVKADI